MGVQVVWDNDEKTIVRYIFEERYTWDEFESAGRQHIEMMKTTDGPVGVILDYPKNVMPPMYALSIGREHVSRRDPRNYLIVVSTTSLLLRGLIGLFRRFYPKESEQIMLVASVEEARTLLAQHRPTQTAP
jgi:hypothetical protein